MKRNILKTTNFALSGCGDNFVRLDGDCFGVATGDTAFDDVYEARSQCFSLNADIGEASLHIHKT